MKNKPVSEKEPVFFVGIAANAWILNSCNPRNSRQKKATNFTSCANAWI
jgi:hypothetical protein